MRCVFIVHRYRLYFKSGRSDVPNGIRDRLDRSNGVGSPRALCDAIVRTRVALVGRGDSSRWNAEANWPYCPFAQGCFFTRLYCRRSVILTRGSAREIEGVPLLGGLRSAARLRESGVKTALVWDSRTQGKTLSYLSRVFSHVVIIRDGESLALERVRVRNLGGVLGIELTNELLRSRNRILKRLIDLVVSVPMTILACPLILVSGIAIKLTSSGPMFFRHKRVGLGGRTFQVLKLRTMHVDAEKRLAEFLEQDPTARAEWERSVKLRNDPRIIPVVGHLLRRFSIDELPQLLAVIRGTMSLVGPRPFPPYHMEVFPAEFAMLRCSVRPGLTGMWQVMTRSDGNLQDQMRYDSYYIRNWSLWFDIYLLARTVFAVIGGGSR